jgi:hypothetical protein
MAPRAPESVDAVIQRIKKAGERLDRHPVRFGAPHHSHAVLLEAGRYRVRALAAPPEKVEAYRREHSSFMPEHYELLSEPIGAIELDCATLDELIAALRKSKYRF